VLIAAHQPLYLPWLGFFAKMAEADVFVLMDDLQYEAQNFQNRNKVKVNNGPLWLTVPLKRGPQQERICDKRIAPPTSPKEDWRQRTIATLQKHYGPAAGYAAYAKAIEEVLSTPWERLVDLNVRLIRTMMEWLGVDRPLLFSSDLRLEGFKTDRILDLCRKTGATEYLSGSGGSRSYLDVPRLEAAGITVRWQTFSHPRYPQRYEQLGFLSGLSALDLLLNCGTSSERWFRGALAGRAGVQPESQGAA
jgi:hypothetical protein